MTNDQIPKAGCGGEGVRNEMTRGGGQVVLTCEGGGLYYARCARALLHRRGPDQATLSRGLSIARVLLAYSSFEERAPPGAVRRVAQFDTV
jgi:hypothetical protein